MPDQKYKPQITFRFRGLMVQCFNSIPKFTDKSGSLTRRLIMIPFRKCFTGHMKEYIKDDFLKKRDFGIYL